MKKRSEQKEDTRKRLVEVAQNLFIEEGYEETTIRQIAKKAGVATGTIFVHYPDKTALLAAVLHDTLENVLVEAYHTLPKKGGPQKKILHIVGYLFRNYARHPELSLHLIKNSVFKYGSTDEVLNRQRSQFIKKIEELLKEGQKTNTISTKLNVNMAACGVWSNYMLALLAALESEFNNVEQHLIFFNGLLDISFNGMHPETCTPKKNANKGRR